METFCHLRKRFLSNLGQDDENGLFSVYCDKEQTLLSFSFNGICLPFKAENAVYGKLQNAFSGDYYLMTSYYFYVYRGGGNLM